MLKVALQVQLVLHFDVVEQLLVVRSPLGGLRVRGVGLCLLPLHLARAGAQSCSTSERLLASPAVHTSSVARAPEILSCIR